MTVIGKIKVFIMKKKGLTIRKNSRFIAPINLIAEPYLVSIGSHVTISSDVYLITHDGATWVGRNNKKYTKIIRFGKISIGDNCFIGAKSIIMPGVKLGNNVIIGAGSVVTKDIADNSVFAGNPARFITNTQDYLEKCLKATPEFNINEYKRNKRKVVESFYL